MNGEWRRLPQVAREKPSVQKKGAGTGTYKGKGYLRHGKITAISGFIPKNYGRRITTSMTPMPTAPRRTAGSTGDELAGVSLGHEVGTFSVDFLTVVVVFTVVAVTTGAVVSSVVSDNCWSEGFTVYVFPEVTVTASL